MVLPDANQIFRHLNGKLHLINKLRFLNYKRRKTITRARGTVAGVIPKFQNSGVESGIFYQMKQVMANLPDFATLLAEGKIKRQYRDHRLDWMIRGGGISITRA